MGRILTRLTFPLALLLITIILAICATSGTASPPPREYQVKAAFLYNFARFTEWPPGTFSSPKDPLILCVFGQDPFGSDLEETVKGRTAGDRDIAIRRMTDVPDGASAAVSCQMVFVSASEKKRFRGLLEQIAAVSAVLTVGDTSGFAQAGGVINLYLEGESVRFEVNLDATDRSHLKISSALLGLARIVHDGGNPK